MKIVSQIHLDLFDTVANFVGKVPRSSSDDDVTKMITSSSDDDQAFFPKSLPLCQTSQDESVI